jgi:hypothetical protein
MAEFSAATNQDKLVVVDFFAGTSIPVVLNSPTHVYSMFSKYITRFLQTGVVRYCRYLLGYKGIYRIY